MRVLIFSILLFSGIAQAQVTGPLADSGRKVITEFDFKITGHKQVYLFLILQLVLMDL
jgi:hypothetical protein